MHDDPQHLIRTMPAKGERSVGTIALPAHGALAALGALALTFSYAAVAASIPDTVPQALLLQTSGWAFMVVVAYLVYARFTGHPLGPLWTFPRARWVAWLAVVAAAVVAAAVALPPAGQTRFDLVRVGVVTVVGEEVLFRGLVWDIVRSAARGVVARPDLVALAVTTVLFAVSHLQYHDFRLTLESTGQVGYTLVAGALLGWARARTGGLPVPMLLHATGNAALKLLGHLPGG